MIPGVGFTELLVIFMMILLFFGSKEIPQLMREAGKLVKKARTYTDAVKREIDQITRDSDPEASPTYGQEITNKKNVFRERHIAARKALGPEERERKSLEIVSFLMADETVKKAGAVMVYVDIGSEVQTRELISRLAAAGKRIVLPFVRKESRTLGIASITDLAKDTAAGELGIPEPVDAIRDNFFKSDLQLILCPGVGFDIHGARLGRGKAYYDNFLRELKGKIPIWGVGFDCQISQDRFPFDYHDITMNQVVTESGFLLKNEEAAG